MAFPPKFGSYIRNIVSVKPKLQAFSKLGVYYVRLGYTSNIRLSCCLYLNYAMSWGAVDESEGPNPQNFVGLAKTSALKLDLTSHLL